MARRPSPDLAIGQRIKTRRKLLGWSVRYAADRAGISSSSLSRIERGLQTADNRFTLAAIAEALRCPVTDLTALPTAPVDRDQAETGGAVYEAVRAIIEADLDFEPALGPGPRPDLDGEVNLVQDLTRRCDYTGAALRLPALVRGLHVAAYGPQRAQALRLLVIAEENASVVVQYAGHPASACLVADRAWQAAVALEHPVMLGMAAFARAHAVTGNGLYERSLTIADRAVDDLQPHLAQPEAPEILGMLLLTSAYSLYALGRVDDAAERMVEAKALADRVGDTDTFKLMFGPTNVAFWRISMEADGPEPGRAVEIARTTNPAGAATTSRQAFFYMETGRALSRIGKNEEALRMLLTAERLAPQRIRSPLVAETVRGLLEKYRRGASGWTELRGLSLRLGVGG